MVSFQLNPGNQAHTNLKSPITRYDELQKLDEETKLAISQLPAPQGSTQVSLSYLKSYFRSIRKKLELDYQRPHRHGGYHRAAVGLAAARWAHASLRRYRA